MENDTLKEVLDLEKQINERIETEKAQAAEWLRQAQLAIQDSTRAEIARVKQAGAQRQQAAGHAAAENAGEIVGQATILAERIKNLDSAYLKQIVWAHVAGIVPRTHRDR